MNYGLAAAAPDTNNKIVGNYVSGFGDSGIRLRDGATANLVAYNRVEFNGKGGDPTTGDGISLENAKNNVIFHNQSLNNRRYGIHVDTLSNGNSIVRNTMLHNGLFDADDESLGSGTAGTANFWAHNFCETENRPGLCEHKKHDSHDDDNDDD